VGWLDTCVESNSEYLGRFLAARGSGFSSASNNEILVDASGVLFRVERREATPSSPTIFSTVESRISNLRRSAAAEDIYVSEQRVAVGAQDFLLPVPADSAVRNLEFQPESRTI